MLWVYFSNIGFCSSRDVEDDELERETNSLFELKTRAVSGHVRYILSSYALVCCEH